MRVPTSLLRSRITIEPYLGNGAYGPSYGTAVECRARVEGRRRAIRTAAGVDVISTAQATIRPDVSVATPPRPPAPEDRVTHDGRTYEVLDVIVGEGLSRPSHRDLLLGGPR